MLTLNKLEIILTSIILFLVIVICSLITFLIASRRKIKLKTQEQNKPKWQSFLNNMNSKEYLNHEARSILTRNQGRENE